MSQSEKAILQANIKLVDEKKELLRDIAILIRYLRGDKELKEEVKSIIKYYDTISNYKKSGK